MPIRAFQKSPAGAARAILGLDWTADPRFSERIMTSSAILLRDGFGMAAEAQRAVAVACAARHGLTVARIYTDDGRRPRHVRHALLRGAGVQFSTLVVASITVLGTTMPEVLGAAAVLQERGVRLVAADGDEDAIAGLRAALPMLLEMQAALRHEAVLRGRARARKRGVQFGRPRLPEEKITRARNALAAGAGVRQAARLAGLSPASVVRLRALAPA